MKNWGGVYEIINTVNNKRYVGSSVRVRDRWSRHKSGLRRNCHGNKHLQNAWNKYGKEKFIFKVIVYSEPEECLRIENLLLATGNYEYNIAKDAIAPTLGMTGELSPWYGKTLTKEHRENISKGNTGKKMSEDFKRKLRNRVYSDEHRRKISEANRKRICTEETRQKMRDNCPDRSGKNNPNYGNTKLRGENNPRWINLSNEELSEMKLLRERGYTYKELGNAFGVSHGTAWSVINNSRYDLDDWERIEAESR